MTKTTLGRLTMALLFALAAWLSRTESRLAARVADTRQAVATLAYDEVDAGEPGTTMSDYLSSGRPLAGEVRVARATAAYWLGRYDAIAVDTNDTSADALVLLTAANAAFRQSQRAPAAGPAGVQRLDGVLQAYASAMKAVPQESNDTAKVLTEAAYNYEYVARLRDQLARTPRGSLAKTPAPAGAAGDLPIGATIHGQPGAPPPDAKMEELQMLAPMEYGDREAQPEATPGARRERKG